MLPPKAFFFFYPAPGQRFPSRLQPGALRDAARGLLPAPPRSALPPGHSRHRGHPPRPRHRCCGYSGRHEAADNFGGGERGTAAAPRPAAMAAGGSAHRGGCPSPPAARAPRDPGGLRGDRQEMGSAGRNNTKNGCDGNKSNNSSPFFLFLFSCFPPARRPAVRLGPRGRTGRARRGSPRQGIPSPAAGEGRDRPRRTRSRGRQPPPGTKRAPGGPRPRPGPSPRTPSRTARPCGLRPAPAAAATPAAQPRLPPPGNGAAGGAASHWPGPPHPPASSAQRGRRLAAAPCQSERASPPGARAALSRGGRCCRAPRRRLVRLRAERGCRRRGGGRQRHSRSGAERRAARRASAAGKLRPRGGRMGGWMDG